MLWSTKCSIFKILESVHVECYNQVTLWIWLIIAYQMFLIKWFDKHKETTNTNALTIYNQASVGSTPLFTWILSAISFSAFLLFTVSATVNVNLCWSTRGRAGPMDHSKAGKGSSFFWRTLFQQKCPCHCFYAGNQVNTIWKCVINSGVDW